MRLGPCVMICTGKPSLSLSNPLSLSLVSFSPSLSLVSSLSPLPLSLFTTQTQVILFQTNFSIFQYFKMQDTREQPGSNPGAPEFPKTGLLIVLTQNHLYKPKTNPGATRERPNFQNSILAQNNIILEKRGISKLSCCGCPQLRNF